MTVAELKAELNELRSSPAWRNIWTALGHDPGLVCQCLREMVVQAEKRLAIGDEKGFHAWAQHALRYAKGELLEEVNGEAYEGPVGPGMRFPGDPMPQRPQPAEPAGLIEEWVEFLKRMPGDMTFRQACAMFKQRHGYWPRWTWPGLPRLRLEKFARIKDVPPERLNQ